MESLWLQTLLLLVISFVIFGPNVAQMHGKRDISGIGQALDAVLVACMAILGMHWLLQLCLMPRPDLLIIAMDAVMVSCSLSVPFIRLDN